MLLFSDSSLGWARMTDGLGPLLWRLLRAGGNSLRRLCVQQPVRAAAVVFVIGTVWLLIFGLSYGVLEFLNQPKYESLKAPLLRSLLNLFFFALFFLVLLSNALVVWSGLFRTKTAIYQAQLPVTSRSLYWAAAVEGGLWAGWAVLVLAVPLILALTFEASQPLWFIPTSLAILFGFLACCMAGGALGAVLLARLIPLMRRGWRGFLLVGVGLVVALTLVALGSVESGEEPANFLREVMGRISFIENPYLPPSWAQRAIDAATISNWSEWGYLLALLVLSSIALAIAGEGVAVRRLRIDLDLLCGRSEATRRSRSKAWRPVPGLPQDLGILVAKDLRLFLRDPAQLLQFGLFFGMLAFYIMLLPRIGQAFLLEEWWRKAVSLLNLTAVSMALATFTGRFVYPLLSLEGRRLWVLILAPWDRRRVVTAKLAFALLVGVPISVLLVSLSGTLLQLEVEVVAYQALVTLCMGLGLSAGALGLGARLADYSEDNPAKLVSGYGGTINLLASLLYATLLLAGAAIPLIVPYDHWGWTAGLVWVLTFTTLWTVAGMHVAWTWFGRDDGTI
jgi:ABC-2 type transport system permease protein